MHLSFDGVELLVHVTQLALSAGHVPGALGCDASVGRSLAFCQLLQYQNWGYQQTRPPEEQLEVTHRANLHSLPTHLRFVPLLPVLVCDDEALCVGALCANSVW